VVLNTKRDKYFREFVARLHGLVQNVHFQVTLRTLDVLADWQVVLGPQAFVPTGLQANETACNRAFPPMEMWLSGQQFRRAFADPFGMLATQKAPVVEKELE